MIPGSTEDAKAILVCSIYFFTPSFAYSSVNSIANILQDEAAALHRNGCCLLPFADPTYELKGTKAFIHEDRELFFKDRITAICDTFKVSHPMNLAVTLRRTLNIY